MFFWGLNPFGGVLDIDAILFLKFASAPSMQAVRHLYVVLPIHQESIHAMFNELFRGDPPVWRCKAIRHRELRLMHLSFLQSVMA